MKIKRMKNLKYKIIIFSLVASIKNVSAHENFGNLPPFEINNSSYSLSESYNFSSKKLFNKNVTTTQRNTFTNTSAAVSTITLRNVKGEEKTKKVDFIQQVLNSNLKLSFKLSRNLNLVITYN